MAENENGAIDLAPQIKLNTLTQFVRDLSFENLLAQRGIVGEVQPEIQVNVNLDAKKRTAEHQYEVSVKLNVTSRNVIGSESLYLMELDYVGIFSIEGVPEGQLHPILLIECPRMLFPFIRRVVSDISRDGGFPALNLENIDFLALYRAEIARRQTQTPTQ